MRIARAARVVLGLLTVAGAPAAASADWERVAGGLEVLHAASPAGGVPVAFTAVRVDPARFRFRVLSASVLRRPPLPAPEWAARFGVTGVVNAALFQADGVTAVGHLRGAEGTNNGGWSRDGGVFVAEPRGRGLAAAAILDAACEPARRRARSYEVVVQGKRMIDCAGRNLWPADDRLTTMAALGQDGEGRILLVHTRAPATPHDLVEAVRRAVPGLRRLLYLEGGSESSLFVKAGGREVASEAGGLAGLLGGGFRPIPNVIAFQPR